ncbi:MAG: ycjS [Verrucomicrobiales bacterium]|nr:ycjS [Verrucomicrobiales bacterium]
MIAVAEAKPSYLDRTTAVRTPRLGFLGVGWIGRSRMEAIARSGCAEIAAIADPAKELVQQAIETCGQCELAEPQIASSLDELLETDLDGVVIATPSALHAEQSIACLERGLAVFCQKPLARNGNETRRVVESARANDCLLSVDLSYRHLTGVKRIRDLLRQGTLGQVYAVELAFHNAYGPDKAWFYDRKLSGGGCVIDLGIHLVDLALWALDFPEVGRVTSRLFQNGKPLKGGIEDYASARLDLNTGTTVQMACSWKLPAGCDAIISAAFYGSKGGAVLRNVTGSFFDFTADHCVGTQRRSLASPPDEWQGRAAVDWARRLACGMNFDCEVEHLVEVARTLDHIYACDGGSAA